jgi:ATP-binding cassette subfamily B (MDR/TAP) protein 1
MSLVQHNPTLFDTTIFENVRYGLVGTSYENSSEEHIRNLVREACRTANAHDFISKLPSGYETLVGEGGAMLSGGHCPRPDP